MNITNLDNFGYETDVTLLEEELTVQLVDEKAKVVLSESTLIVLLSEILILEKNTGGGEEVVTVIPFTNADLVNGQLIKLHGLNRRVVSVTLTDSNGLEFEPRINNLNDNTRVLIDLSRYGTLQGTWYLTIR